MNKSQLMVLPSLQDGSGIVISQALKTGLPVIVTENTGTEKLVKEFQCGYVVPIRDSNILHYRIDYLGTGWISDILQDRQKYNYI